MGLDRPSWIYCKGNFLFDALKVLAIARVGCLPSAIRIKARNPGDMRREAYRKPSGIGTTPPSAKSDWHFVLDLEVFEVPANVGVIQSRRISSRNPEACQWLYLIFYSNYYSKYNMCEKKHPSRTRFAHRIGNPALNAV